MLVSVAALRGCGRDCEASHRPGAEMYNLVHQRGMWAMGGKESTGDSGVWGCLTTLCILALLILGGYEWLESVAWVSHREETLITVNADWLVGESKQCWSITLDSRSAALLHKETGYAMYSVNCGDGAQHSIKVNFYGSEIQGANRLINWRCEREQPSFLNDNSFTCYETGTQEAPTPNP